MTVNDIGPVSMISPIYNIPGLGSGNTICAALTGRGTSAEENHNFSFHRPPSPDPSSSSTTCERTKNFRRNIDHLATHLGFNARMLTWPNGTWPHSGQVIIAEEYKWVNNSRTTGLMPVATEGDDEPVTYDGVVTRSRDFVLGVQGADCSSIFMYDPSSGVIGLVHAGWKPVVRGVVKNAVDAMVKCGACRENIFAYISPGIGDRFNEFHWDDMMEPQVRDVFAQAGRKDLLETSWVRRDMTDDDRVELALALGRKVRKGSSSFKLEELTASELQSSGLKSGNISRSNRSTIVDRHPPSVGEASGDFRYQSYRRERPDHGLSMSVLFLKK